MIWIVILKFSKFDDENHEVENIYREFEPISRIPDSQSQPSTSKDTQPLILLPVHHRVKKKKKALEVHFFRVNNSKAKFSKFPCVIRFIHISESQIQYR